MWPSQKSWTLPIWIVDLRGSGSVDRKSFWTRPISNFSISRPKGREIEIGDQSLVQKIFRYTDPFTLRSSIHIGKIQTFWEAHKIWKQFPHGLDVYKGNVQTMRKIFPNFVCFLESSNFTNKKSLTFSIYMHTVFPHLVSSLE